MLDLLFSNPFMFCLLLGCLILALTVHEFSHAYVANMLGDPTAKYLNRISLNPMRHIDPLGLLLMVLAGFGWGRAVPFNPNNFSNPKRDIALVSLAGPASNFILAVICLGLGKLGLGPITGFLVLFSYYNLFLCFFNLLPVAPLDGFKIVAGFLPHNLMYQWMQMERYGNFILIALLISDIPSKLVSPIVDFFIRFFFPL